MSIAHLKIEKLIRKLERDIAERQHQCDHGSSMSTMREDMAEGEVAKALRAIVSDLRDALESDD